MRTLGVVLAGGRGERLGLERPKALVTLEGRTLLDRAVATLSQGCDRVTIAAPRGVELPVTDPDRRVVDLGEGPLSGMVAALGQSRFDRAFVMAVDFPLLRPEAIAFLLDRLPGAVAAVPAPHGRLQPLAAAYAAAAAPLLARAYESGERSAARAVEGLDPRVVGEAELAGVPGGLDNWLNVNVPGDLAEATRLLRARAGIA